MSESSAGHEQRGEIDALVAALPDLSADTVEQFEALAQTRWFAAVKIPLSRTVPEEKPLCAAVASRLLGRNPSAIYTTAKDELWVNFWLESGNDEARQSVSRFVDALAALVGASGREADSMYGVRYVDDPLGYLPVNYDQIKHL